ncbi:hypothetical protein DF3PA_70119 [Candidatus Defluviicoccus seviourii]|uniref:Uncharacterized protein n=1 Tax=Candidatus Defluviicoccus seviourii TaxID=2565273 RepID=A0A564WIM1_9PROT|nr:hypothetical protein DF3PA_70119 [Candidatus Defluviicoccus seviourii]
MVRGLGSKDDLLIRKLELECERMEWEFARDRQEYIETRLAFDYITEAFTQVASKIRDLPKRVAPILGGVTKTAPEIEEMVRGEIESLLGIITLESETTLIEKVNGSISIQEDTFDDDQESVPAETKPKRKPVGRPKPSSPRNSGRKGKMAN